MPSRDAGIAHPNWGDLRGEAPERGSSLETAGGRQGEADRGRGGTASILGTNVNILTAQSEPKPIGWCLPKGTQPASRALTPALGAWMATGTTHPQPPCSVRLGFTTSHNSHLQRHRRGDRLPAPTALPPRSTSLRRALQQPGTTAAPAPQRPARARRGGTPQPRGAASPPDGASIAPGPRGGGGKAGGHGEPEGHRSWGAPVVREPAQLWGTAPTAPGDLPGPSGAQHTKYWEQNAQGLASGEPAESHLR